MGSYICVLVFAGSCLIRGDAHHSLQVSLGAHHGLTAVGLMLAWHRLSFVAVERSGVYHMCRWPCSDRMLLYSALCHPPCLSNMLPACRCLRIPISDMEEEDIGRYFDAAQAYFMKTKV